MQLLPLSRCFRLSDFLAPQKHSLVSCEILYVVHGFMFKLLNITQRIRGLLANSLRLVWRQSPVGIPIPVQHLIICEIESSLHLREALFHFFIHHQLARFAPYEVGDKRPPVISESRVAFRHQILVSVNHVLPVAVQEKLPLNVCLRLPLRVTEEQEINKGRLIISFENGTLEQLRSQQFPCNECTKRNKSKDFQSRMPKPLQKTYTKRHQSGRGY